VRPGASTRHTACRRLLRLRHTSGCLGSSSTTSPTPRVRVARLVGSSSTTWLTSRVRVPQLVVRLVVDYFAYVARPGASARHEARRRLLRLRRTSRCLGSLGGLSSATSPMLCDRVPRLLAWLVVDLAPSRHSTSRQSVALALTVRPVTPSRVSTTCRLAATALLRLHCAFGCAISPLDFSSVGCTSSHRAPGHSVSQLDYSVRGLRDFVLRPHLLYFSHAMRCDYLSRGNTASTSSMSRATATSSPGRIASTTHLN
jgi:hypothetical protein